MTSTSWPSAGHSIPSAGKEPVGRGETRSTHNQSTTTDALPTADGGAAPRVEPQLPHEIDESAHSQERASARQVDVGKQALEDTIGPAQDTDRGPVLDAVYNATLAPDRGATEPRH
jgi:hypothetical protein